MDMLYTILATMVALGLLVTVHELGHFGMARYCGVRVLKFSIGFGSPLFRWQNRKGTEFIIAAVPLGGYVKMLDEREGHVAPHELDQAFNRKSVKARFAIVAAGPLVNFMLAWLLFWLLALQGSHQVKPVIGAIVQGSLAERAGLQAGQEILSLDGEITSSWTAINLHLVGRLGETGRLTFGVRAADETTEQTRSVALEDWLRNEDDPDPIERLGITPWRPQLEPLIAELDPQGPAKAAGLQVGDKVLQLNGQPIADWAQLVDLIRARPEQTVALQVERQGRSLDIKLTLGKRDGKPMPSGYLGAGVQAVAWPSAMVREVHFGPFEAFVEGGRKTWRMSILTLDSLKKMLLGQLSVKNLSGPITIAKVAGASAQSGLGDFLSFLAYLSISLGVLNLLPVPVLDGGHLLFYLVEWVRGRPLSEQVQNWGMQIGISLMIGVMLLALFNDIGRL